MGKVRNCIEMSYHLSYFQKKCIIANGNKEKGYDFDLQPKVMRTTTTTSERRSSAGFCQSAHAQSSRPSASRPKETHYLENLCQVST